LVDAIARTLSAQSTMIRRWETPVATAWSRSRANDVVVDFWD
jgi:hypothetical protein